MSIFYLLTLLIYLAYTALIIFYLIGWKRTESLAVKQRTTDYESRTRVSIILPARNEEENILDCLSALYKQTYPLDDFEIIVVDDHSTDRTAELVEKLEIENLKLIRSNDNSAGGKKSAITEGIKNSSGDLIITTDADCRMGNEWLASIVSFYQNEKPKMIVAPVMLNEEKKFLDNMQSLEMLALTGCGAGAIFFGKPILCSGANLAYEKNVFCEVNGFDGNEKNLSGDDVFLMLKINRKFLSQIKFLKSKEATVFTKPGKNLSSFFQQRKRWASKTFSYTEEYVTAAAVIIFLSNFFILLSAAVSILKSTFVPIAIVLLVKCLVDFMLLNSVSTFFGKKKLLIWFLISALIYPLYVFLTGSIAPLTNFSWKGRKNK